MATLLRAALGRSGLLSEVPIEQVLVRHRLLVSGPMPVIGRKPVPG